MDTKKAAGHNRLSARVLIWTLADHRGRHPRQHGRSQSPVGSSPDLDRHRLTKDTSITVWESQSPVGSSPDLDLQVTIEQLQKIGYDVTIACRLES